MWHSGFHGFEETKIQAPNKPTLSEAAQIVAVQEDVNLTDITVDSIKVIYEKGESND
jgi:hypothetical protein